MNETILNDQIVIQIKENPRDSKIKAFADVTFVTSLGELTVKGFRIIQDGEKAAWIGFPSISYQKDGQTKNYPIIELSKMAQKRLTEKIMEEFNPPF